MKETPIERITHETQKIVAFLNLLDISKKQNVELIDMIRMSNDEQQDILHELELNSLLDGEDKARKIKELRQVRRALKDTIDLWRPIKEFADSHKELREELNKLIDDIQQIVNNQTTRVYYPRINADSDIMGKHYLSNKIDIEEITRQMEFRKQQIKAIKKQAKREEA